MLEGGVWIVLAVVAAIVTRGVLAPLLVGTGAAFTLVGRSADVLLPRLGEGDAYRVLVLSLVLVTGGMVLLAAALVMVGRALVRRLGE